MALSRDYTMFLQEVVLCYRNSEKPNEFNCISGFKSFQSADKYYNDNIVSVHGHIDSTMVSMYKYGNIFTSLYNKSLRWKLSKGFCKIRRQPKQTSINEPTIQG
jgi:hypothetical protein